MVDVPTGLEDSTRGVRWRRLLGKAMFEEANRDAVFNVSSQRNAGVCKPLGGAHEERQRGVFSPLLVKIAWESNV